MFDIPPPAPYAPATPYAPSPQATQIPEISQLSKDQAANALKALLEQATVYQRHPDANHRHVGAKIIQMLRDLDAKQQKAKEAALGITPQIKFLTGQG